MNIKNKVDIVIIGGGASGMAAAIEAKRQNRDISVTLLEKKSDVGLKLKATGNGKCNISNYKTSTFGDTVKFFRSIGVEIKSLSDGRAYPVSERADDVVKALKMAMETYGVEIVTDFEVTSVEKNEEGFIINGNNESYLAKKLVLSTGGKAGSIYGTIGDGFKFAKSLGHSVTSLRPILTPIECESDYLKDLKGIRAKGSCALHIGSHQDQLEIGEIQFTEDGLSGICIFDLSIGIELKDGLTLDSYHIRLNLLADYDFREILMVLQDRCKIEGLSSDDILMSIVNENIAKQVINHLNLNGKLASELTREELESLIYELMNLKFNIKGLKGWKVAQSTGGGITFSEFNYETMKSNKCDGLFITGELIDYDCRCGGYNLENAWNTGRKAGKSACTELAK